MNLLFFYLLFLGHISRMNKTSVSASRNRWFKSSYVQICYALGQDNLSALLQSTQLTDEDRREHPCKGSLFSAMSSPMKIALENQCIFYADD